MKIFGLNIYCLNPIRGKDEDEEEWHYGSLIVRDEYLKEPPKYELFGEYNDIYPLIPDTIGQYTGLKDKNGTKIFEGDIISVRGKYPKVVKFIDEYACYCLANIEDLYNDLCSPWQQVGCGWWRDRQEYIEIIGNVYDNKNDY